VPNALVVVNSGSSGVKFSLFLMRGSEVELDLHGQIEGIYTAPRFVAKRHDGTLIADTSLNGDTKLGHDAALDHLVRFLRSQLGDLGMHNDKCQTPRPPVNYRVDAFIWVPEDLSKNPRSLTRPTRSRGSNAAADLIMMLPLKPCKTIKWSVEH